jgi:hypothetical protein
MANLPETAQWEEGIYEWALDDPVEGGPGGIDNLPTLQLANRTRYLHQKLIEQEPFGFHMEFDFEPTPLELALWRCLPLNGQIVEISLYQRLCDRKYCGDAANDTADWWYKCDYQGYRTTTGQYMRVLDHRGVFSRPAGKNSLYKCANDTPYDGGSIGAFQPDDNKSHDHSLFTPTLNWQIGEPRLAGGEGYASLPLSTVDNVFIGARGGSEAKPASISSFLCIKY